MKLTSLEKIVSAHLREGVHSMDRIHGKGEVNEIYVLTTGSAKYVLRVDPSESSLARFEKEAWCINAAENVGVLVPKVFGTGLEEGHPYILLSYCEGHLGADADGQQKKLIWRGIGEYARKLHSVPVKGFGEMLSSPGTFKGSWSDYLDFNIGSLDSSDKLLALGAITGDQSAILRDNILRLKNTAFNFGLIHNDLSLKNAILGTDGGVFLLDWGSAGADVVPHGDFDEILHFSLRENSEEFALFLDTYGMSRTTFEKIKPDIYRLRLLKLTDKIRWAIDKKPEALKQKVKELKEALISYLPALSA